MLYDPKWAKPETKADVFSLESLIAWLEKQPADKVYCYYDEGHCLAAQYNKSVGREYKVSIIRCDGSFHDTLERIASYAPHTFGAALDRARKALAESA